MYGRTYRRMDGRTDGQTGTPSYKVASELECAFSVLEDVEDGEPFGVSGGGSGGGGGREAGRRRRPGTGGDIRVGQR